MRLFKIVAISLIVASLPFLMESGYEMFVLTALYGPQMLFFSLMHSWPVWLIAIFLASWLVYFALLALSSVVTIAALAGKFKAHFGFVRTMQVTFGVLAIHFALGLSYEHWSASLFGR